MINTVVVGHGLAGRAFHCPLIKRQPDLHLYGIVARDPRFAAKPSTSGVHGVGRTAWDLIDVAAQRGYDTRIGLEDTLALPDGTQARGNAELVVQAAKACAPSCCCESQHLKFVP